MSFNYCWAEKDEMRQKLMRNSFCLKTLEAGADSGDNDGGLIQST